MQAFTHTHTHARAQKIHTHLAAFSQCYTQILPRTTETALNAFVMESFIDGLCICGCAVFAVVFNRVFICCSSRLYRQNQCLWKSPATNLLLTDSHWDFSYRLGLIFIITDSFINLWFVLFRSCKL